MWWLKWWRHCKEPNIDGGMVRVINLVVAVVVVAVVCKPI